jgi:hypothetical protein
LISHGVSIDNSPSLTWMILIIHYPNWLSFFILEVLDGNDLLSFKIDKWFTLVLEHLPPVGASAVVLQVVGFTGVVDIDGLVDWSTSDGSRRLMEVPFLSWSTILSLDNKISSWEVINISLLS